LDGGAVGVRKSAPPWEAHSGANAHRGTLRVYNREPIRFGHGRSTMSKSARKLAFVLAASDHGAMIVSRLDYRMTPKGGIGVGYQILETGAFDAGEVSIAMSILELRRKYFKDGVLAIDCGANIGVHTIEWAKRMTGWGQVLAIEAQERIYYALAGNIAINNCFNAVALNAAVADKPGVLRMPQPDYLVPGFGSLELRKRANTEFIGQAIDYSDERLTAVQAIAIDTLKLSRIDFIKIDVEGMELEALAGAAESIAQHRPAVLVESIKAGAAALREWLTARDYKIFDAGINLFAVHSADPILPHIR
jgi:FkbM family methyltransferase